MKLGIFADPHYSHEDLTCETRRPMLSYGKIAEAMQAFKRENVTLAVCLGDLIEHCETPAETERNLQEILSLVLQSGIPFMNVPGNHDYTDLSAEMLEKYGLRKPPYSVVFDGVRLIVLDANYRSDFRRFDRAGVEWTDANLPPEQLVFLRTTLSKSKEPCVVLVHECLDPYVEPHHIVKDADRIREIIRDSGKVITVLEGHYHPGAFHEIDGIPYRTYPAMCEGIENRYFTIEIDSEMDE